MSDYREACNEAKAVRRGIVEPRPVSRAAKKRQAKPVVVEYRYPAFMAGWFKFGAYADVATAQAVIANKTRTRHSAEYRIKP